MKQLLGVILLITVFQNLFHAMLKFPAVGFLCYVVFLLFAWWKMRELNTRTHFPKKIKNKMPSASMNGNIIDVEYTEKEIND